MSLTSVRRIEWTFHFNPAELKVISSKEIPSEHEEQRAFVSWWRKSLPECNIFAVPNGGGRSKSEASKLKVEGVSPGVPDLFAPCLGVWIEFKKRKGGSVSAEQKEWHRHLRDCGYIVIVPKGAEEAVGMVTDLLKKCSSSRCDRTIDWIEGA